MGENQEGKEEEEEWEERLATVDHVGHIARGSGFWAAKYYHHCRRRLQTGTRTGAMGSSARRILRAGRRRRG